MKKWESIIDSIEFNTHEICVVLCPHVWYQAVFGQSSLEGYLDPGWVTFLQFKVDVGLILRQFRRLCSQLQKDNSVNIMWLYTTFKVICKM